MKTIHAKLAVLNSSAMTQAMAVFSKTGSYPDVVLPEATNVGTTALRAALTQRGKPYVWGAAGPDSYDCSGLVVWAFAQEGISLPHYTGSLWNSGMHVSRADLEPGDLVFFFADISHVGIYVGNGLMVDAPSTGQVVQVQPILELRRRGPHRLSPRAGLKIAIFAIRPSPRGHRGAQCVQGLRQRNEGLSARPDEGEQDRVPDVLAGKHDHQAVHAHAHATGRRHRVLEREQEVLVEFHGLRVAARREQRLRGEPLPLHHGVHQLRVARAELGAERHQVPPLGQPRVERCCLVSGDTSTGKSR